MKHTLAALTEILPRGSVLAVDAGVLAERAGATSVRQVARLIDAGVAEEQHDAVLVGGLAGASALDVAHAVAAHVRPGGTVVFALPTTRSGIKGAASSLVGMLRRRPPMVLEELCEALLVAGLEEVQARELDDASGTSLVWGRVRTS